MQRVCIQQRVGKLLECSEVEIYEEKASSASNSKECEPDARTGLGDKRGRERARAEADGETEKNRSLPSLAQ